MSVQLKILEFQQPQTNGKVYTEKFKKSFFGKTVIANINQLVGDKELEQVSSFIWSFLFLKD
jgi:hypothetical protein